jgi:PAS domain S-box-containing protein
VTTPLRLLIVEDSEDDALLMEHELKRAGFEVVSKRVETVESMKAALETQPWDLVISDYSLPSFSAPAALATLQASGLDLPFIIVSGTVGEDIAVEGMRAGAQDFILKGSLTRLAPAVHRELVQAEQRRAGRKAEEKRKKVEARFRALLESAPDAIVIADGEGRIAFVNVQTEKLFGYSRAELLGFPVEKLIPERFRSGHPALRAGYSAEPKTRPMGAGITLYGKRQDGAEFPVEISLSPLETEEGVLVSASIRDVTDRVQLEALLRQSQRMEAVGQLAGGVAHDFNNLLTAILGYAELVGLRADVPKSAREEIGEIRKAAERAAALTRQLLAFSRKQVLEPVVLGVNELVSNLEKMLRRLIGEDVDLVTLLDPSVSNVRADAGQLEQVIVNLVVNARDAMPRGGRLTIETAEADLDEAYAQRHVAVRPGRYVMVAVSDTGTGMDAETKARIFEPFFTTKEKGKGTGLGLSTVYGIVKQSGGNIWVYSEPGKGTTFKVYLPRVEEILAEGAPRSQDSLPAVGTETVLVVEDEPSIRTLSRRVLEARGYRVLEAGNGKDALERVRGEEGPIHLLLTDLVMPDMPGTELASRLEQLRPGVRVLFMSGYTDDGVVRNGLLGSGRAFLQKPFTPTILANKVREILS